MLYPVRDFLVFSGAEIQPQISAPFAFEFRRLFPNFEKKKLLLFFKKYFHSVTTHTSYMVAIHYHCILFLLQFNGKVCAIANLFSY